MHDCIVKHIIRLYSTVCFSVDICSDVNAALDARLKLSFCSFSEYIDINFSNFPEEGTNRPKHVSLKEILIANGIHVARYYYNILFICCTVQSDNTFDNTNMHLKQLK